MYSISLNDSSSVFPKKALQGGGPLIDIGTHALDITLWMMNNYKPVSVTGSVLKPTKIRFSFRPDRTPQGEE